MTDIATNLDTIDDSLSDIKTAIVAKGVTPSGNITTFATAISGITPLNGETVNITPSTSAQTITPTSPANGITQANVSAVTSSIDANIQAGNIKDGVTILGVTGSYSGGGSSGKYQLLDRVTDDSNNEIGTVCGFFTDANNTEYAVVCLDGNFRSNNLSYGVTSAVTDLPSLSAGKQYSSKDTATFNTQKILDYHTTAGQTSYACTHCRNQSFTIDGTTYYGQLPNIDEAIDIISYRTEINTVNPSELEIGQRILSSTQVDYANNWVIDTRGTVVGKIKDSTNYMTIPVLEIPNAVS